MRRAPILFLLASVATPAAAAAQTVDREVITVQSAILGEPRRVFVSVPAGFEKSGPARRYPLLLVTDGEGHSAAAVVDAARELARHGLVPDMVIAGIENVGSYEKRLRDLTPPGLSVSGSSRNEGGDRFLDFLERELMPMLDARFRTAAPRLLVGHSSGGIIATYAAATRDTYRLVVALDTPAHLDAHWLSQKLIARARAGGAPMRYASYNSVYGWNDAQWAELTSAAPESWVLRHARLEHETHNSMPLLGAYLGLRELFTDYSRKAAPVYPTTSILPYYRTLETRYGASLLPPAPLMRDVVDDLLLEGRGAAAGEAFGLLVESNGEPSNATEIRARIADVSARPAPAETVESLLATPMAPSAEAAAYIGEWAGEARRGENHVTRFTLSIVEKDGRVAGQVLWQFAPGEELAQPLQYFTVQPGGITYGYMNGMRPRGMLLYPMTRTGPDTIEGLMRWGGVDPPSHNGVFPPPESIVLRRMK